MKRIWEKKTHVIDIGDANIELTDDQFTLVNMWLHCFLINDDILPLMLFPKSTDNDVLFKIERGINETCEITTRGMVTQGRWVELERDEVAELVKDMRTYTYHPRRNHHFPLTLIEDHRAVEERDGCLHRNKEGIWVVGEPNSRTSYWRIGIQEVTDVPTPYCVGVIGSVSNVPFQYSFKPKLLKPIN